MMDIKQEEMDKRFVAGALAIESALVHPKYMATAEHIREAARMVHKVIVAEIGEERLAAIQGKSEAQA
ncbi:hypothetical protein [Rhizobium sp. S163]|uniref:hypothetical protein n=1 Tax=Rhizobium sp. S163 TaxID=3055039 RepID=UPI0025A9EC70|nr:hypothetical protein [Rhizobium sp. S163]MDM9643868.1 hypothetical protein [Rhizobium sp. S163]